MVAQVVILSGVLPRNISVNLGGRWCVASVLAVCNFYYTSSSVIFSVAEAVFSGKRNSVFHCGIFTF